MIRRRVVALTTVESYLTRYFPKQPPTSGSQLVKCLRGLVGLEAFKNWPYYHHEGYWHLLRYGSIGGEELKWSHFEFTVYHHFWKDLHYHLLWIFPIEELVYFPEEVEIDSEME